MLTQNSELREIGVWNWTLPAWVVTLSDGTTFNVCPSAGACAQLCYARNGTYLFPTVRAAHIRNLERVLNDLESWTSDMIAHLHKRKYRPNGRSRADVIPVDAELDVWTEAWVRSGGQAVRIHDSGDFFSDAYLNAWIKIAREHPDVLFYAYTKEVERVRNARLPINFRILWSLGGRQDHLIDLDTERHADVFPNVKAIAQAGYRSQDESDLYAVLLPTTRIGIPANRIRHFQKRQGEQTFGTLQSSRHTR